MATIRKDIEIRAAAAAVWDAIRDVGAIPRRLARGFVTATVLEPGARIVTFETGVTVKELIVTVDDAARRLAYAAVGGSATHHNASMEVVPEGKGRCRLIWIADLLPDEAAGLIGPMMERGAGVMKATLEAGNAVD